jgi:4-diphosphocytidyl-2-C-methyl-D-erythritol kinase
MKRQILCPAKINTFLSVGPPDQKGWHPLRSIFQAISLCDVLTLHFGHKEPGIFCDWPDFPAENTLSKTLRLVSESAALPPMRIELEKNIPAQSGLGGGSSDAAGLLKLLHQLFPEALPDYFLQEVALSVGADVPFFLVGGRAKAEGYGEKLTPLDDLPSSWVLVVQPEETVSTPAAFMHLDSLDREWHGFDAAEEGINHFELAAPSVCLEIKSELKAAGADFSLLTGSGSAVFGLFGQDENKAKEAEERFRNRFPFVWLGKTLPREAG